MNCGLTHCGWQVFEGSSKGSDDMPAMQFSSDDMPAMHFSKQPLGRLQLPRMEVNKLLALS
jgi:hypothetical protein